MSQAHITSRLGGAVTEAAGLREAEVFVTPRPGLILAGIPASGAYITAELAAVWEADQLVVRQPEAPPRQSPMGSTPRKHRRPRDGRQ